jgi:hypothetical protein
MLGAGIRVLGTSAMYAYEAAAGVHIDPGLATTEDIDLLFDSRGGLTFVANDEVSESSRLQIIKKVDHSFQRSTQTFRAVNRDGYLVDLIKPYGILPGRMSRRWLDRIRTTLPQSRSRGWPGSRAHRNSKP